MKSIKDRNKNTLGDIGEFLIVLAFSSNSIDDKKVQIKLLEEYIAR